MTFKSLNTLKSFLLFIIDASRIPGVLFVCNARECFCVDMHTHLFVSNNVSSVSLTFFSCFLQRLFSLFLLSQFPSFSPQSYRTWKYPPNI